MRGFIRNILFGGVSLRGMMSGILSSARGGLLPFFALNAPPALNVSHKRKPKAKYGRGTGVRRGWTPRYYGVAGPDSREAERRRRQIERGSLRRENGLRGTVP